MSLADASKFALPPEILGRIAEADSELILSTARSGRIRKQLNNEKSPVVIGFPVSPELADPPCPGRAAAEILREPTVAKKNITPTKAGKSAGASVTRLRFADLNLCM